MYIYILFIYTYMYICMYVYIYIYTRGYRSKPAPFSSHQTSRDLRIFPPKKNTDNYSIRDVDPSPQLSAAMLLMRPAIWRQRHTWSWCTSQQEQCSNNPTSLHEIGWLRVFPTMNDDNHYCSNMQKKYNPSHNMTAKWTMHHPRSLSTVKVHKVGQGICHCP